MSANLQPLDCQGALDRLYEYLDGELTPDIEQAVRSHLDACARCFALFNFEDGFLKFLEARTRAQGAPPELKRRILRSIFEDESAPES